MKTPLATPPAAPACRLLIKVTPGASCDEVAGVHGAAVRIKLRAPPVDGRANQALLGFLAERLGLPRRALALVQGASSPHKTVHIAGLALPAVRTRLGC